MKKRIITTVIAVAILLGGNCIFKSYNFANAFISENVEALTCDENVEFVPEECYVPDIYGDHYDVYRGNGGFCLEAKTMCDEDGTCIDIVVWGN